MIPNTSTCVLVLDVCVHISDEGHRHVYDSRYQCVGAVPCISYKKQLELKHRVSSY